MVGLAGHDALGDEHTLGALGIIGSEFVAIQQTEGFEPLTEYADDFEGFCRDVLGISPWEMQIKIANSVRDNERTAVSACYSSGKTWIAAAIAIHWIYTRRPALLVTTAPTGRQVRDLLWREIRKLIRKAKRSLPGRVLQVRLIIAEDWQGLGFSSDKPNSMAGYHEAKNVLFIEDEAAGMPAEVVAGYDGLTATEGSRHLKIGNPICSSGPFWDAHNKASERYITPPDENGEGGVDRWTCFEISALDTPNYVARKVVVPGLVTYEWVEDKRARWGEDSPLWITKVLGKFYTGSGLKVIPAEWVAAATARHRDLGENPGWLEGPKILGVDIAGGGQDETVAYLLTGRLVQFVEAWQDPDLMAQGRKIAKLAKDLGVDAVHVDRTGLGQGVWSKLLELRDQDDDELPDEIDVVGVQMSETPDDPDTYCAKLDEVQFHMREAFDPTNSEAVIIDPRDTKLQDELPLRGWELVERIGKIKVESKSDLKKRRIPSPDRADSVSLLFCNKKRKAPVETLISVF